MLVTTERLFADHYQFYLYDDGYAHFEDPLLNWETGSRAAHGYLVSQRAIYVSTVSHLNSHRLRIFVGESPTNDYERVFRVKLNLQSGVLVISAPANSEEDDVKVELSPGIYQVVVCSSAIGKDELDVLPDAEEQLNDEEFFLRDDIEYYDVFIEKST